MRKILITLSTTMLVSLAQAASIEQAGLPSPIQLKQWTLDGKAQEISPGVYAWPEAGGRQIVAYGLDAVRFDRQQLWKLANTTGSHKAAFKSCAGTSVCPLNARMLAEELLTLDQIEQDLLKQQSQAQSNAKASSASTGNITLAACQSLIAFSRKIDFKIRSSSGTNVADIDLTARAGNDGINYGGTVPVTATLRAQGYVSPEGSSTWSQVQDNSPQFDPFASSASVYAGGSLPTFSNCANYTGRITLRFFGSTAAVNTCGGFVSTYFERLNASQLCL